MLRVHFLNVGHGDCTIIEHPSGRLTMIDINNSQDYDDQTKKELKEAYERDIAQRQSVLATEDSAFACDAALEALADKEVLAKAKREPTDPILFMKENYPNRRLWRYIQTHPDLDHMRGLYRLENEIGFENFWDTNNNKPDPVFRSDSDRVDWVCYKRQKMKKYYTRGNSYYAFAKDQSGNLGGDNIEILSPDGQLVLECNNKSNSNDISLVIRISHAGRSILFPGDAETLAWNSMIDYYDDKLKSDFLKASHHGRDSGYCMEAVRIIRPLQTFVSVGQKPSTDASSKYRNFSGQVLSTRYYGNLRLEIYNDGSYKCFPQYNGK